MATPSDPKNKKYKTLLSKTCFQNAQKCVFLFTRTISRNQKLQTKAPEKQHVNIASKSECEKYFETYVVIFTYIFSQVH